MTSDDDTERNDRATPRRGLVTPSMGAAETVNLVGPGQVLARRYELGAEIGRGGMGVVYRARDRELAMDVAIKVLPIELSASKRAIRDLKREAVLAMQLKHPGVMALYTLDSDDAVAFLVMELLEGMTLDERLGDEETLSLDETVDIGRQLAACLDYAHGQNVVHRDIKPANVFLRRRDEDATVEVVLTDFGIARQIKDSLSRVSKVDASGTLCYVSPEVLRGRRADGRSDQYSLASTLYECLTGHPPFHSGTIAYQIVNEKPAPIADVPEHVNAVLMRALDKEPERRFPSCTAFAAALGGVGEAAAETTVPPPAPAAPPPPTPGPTSTWFTFDRRLLGPALLCVFLICCVLCAYEHDLAYRAFGLPRLDEQAHPRPTREALRSGILVAAQAIVDRGREADRRETARLEAERLAAERLEAERLAAERLAAERAAAAAAFLEAERRREAEELERRKRAAAAEAERVAAQERRRAEAERTAAEEREHRRRIAAAEAERAAAEEAERRRLAAAAAAIPTPLPAPLVLVKQPEAIIRPPALSKVTFKVVLRKRAVDKARFLELQILPLGGGARSEGNFRMQLDKASQTSTERPYVAEKEVWPGDYEVIYHAKINEKRGLIEIIGNVDPVRKKEPVTVRNVPEQTIDLGWVQFR